MQTLTQEDAKKVFEKQVDMLFHARLARFEWLPDDPHEPMGEPLPNILHAALHLRQAVPGDIDAAADLACSIEKQFDEEYTIISHTLPVAA